MIKTNCLVEYLQMAARAIEIGVFRLVEQLGFSKEKVQHAIGSGLVPPLSDDVNVSNDRVNNALIYGTRLYLVVKSTPEDNLEDIYSENDEDEEEGMRPAKKKGPARRKSRAVRKRASRLNKI